jgi:hypothetical protein
VPGTGSSAVLAHAFGKRYELPIPLLLFVLGGAVVVLASFALVAARQVSQERPDGADDGEAGPPGRLRPVPAVLGVAVLAGLVAAGLAGGQEVAENIVPTAFWLVVWVVVPLSCGLLGDWTIGWNPFGTLSRLADRPGWRRVLLGSEQPVAWPAWLAWWPAVGLYFLIACGELVFNLTATLPRNTAIGLGLYAVVCAGAGVLFGPAWVGRGEVFTVLFATWGRLGVFRFGAPGRRGVAGGLRVPFERSTSRVAFVLLLLISVNFDGLLATPEWASLERGRLGALAVGGARLETFRVGAFLVLALAITLVFGLFATVALRVARSGAGPLAALTGLLPSLVPIAFGYLLAHNVQYVLVNSQLLFPLLGNPVGRESWPVHLPYPFNDSYDPRVQLFPSAVYWYLAVVVIVGVHVLAVVLAHHQLSAAEEDAGPRRARASELPWLVAMVGYTMLSLWLLAQPLVSETTAPAPAAAARGTGFAVAASAPPSTVR